MDGHCNLCEIKGVGREETRLQKNPSVSQRFWWEKRVDSSQAGEASLKEIENSASSRTEVENPRETPNQQGNKRFYGEVHRNMWSISMSGHDIEHRASIGCRDLGHVFEVLDLVPFVYMKDLRFQIANLGSFL